MDTSYSTLAARELLDALRQAGRTPSLDLIRACLERGEELAPDLLRMLNRDPDPKLPSDDPRWYAQIHAGLLLIGLRDESALPIFARQLRDDTAAEMVLDWFNGPLAGYGPAAVSTLLELWNDRRLPVTTRYSLTDPLVAIAVQHPSQRDAIVAALQAVLPALDGAGQPVLRHEPTDDDIVLWTWALDALATLGVVESIPQGVALYRAELVDAMVMGGVDDYLEIFKQPDPARNLVQRQDILAVYEGLHAQAAREREWAAKAPTAKATVPQELRALAGSARVPQAATRPAGVSGSQQPYVRGEPKIGRNDPCPCGSGKKYKKCHGQAR